MKLIQQLCLVVTISCLVACTDAPMSESAAAADPPLAKSGAPADLVACPEPRGDMCTANYDPVCGWRHAGDADSDGVQSTYSNACTACLDKDVIGFVAGPCENN